MDFQKRPITKLGRIATAFSMRQMNCHGTDLSQPEILALRHIARHGGGLSQAELASRLTVDKAAVTRTLNSLEEKGYLRRETDPADKRIKRVYPLEKAFAVKDEALSAEALFYEWLFSDLPPAVQQQMLDTLDTLFEKARLQRKDGFPEVLEFIEKHREDATQ